MGLLQALGLVVRQERLRQGLTQEKLAELADLHVNYVSLVERGLSAPAVDTLAAIARALDTKPSQLLDTAERLMAKESPAT